MFCFVLILGDWCLVLSRGTLWDDSRRSYSAFEFVCFLFPNNELSNSCDPRDLRVTQSAPPSSRSAGLGVSVARGRHSRHLSGRSRHLPRCFLLGCRSTLSASTSSKSRSLPSPAPQCRCRSTVQNEFRYHRTRSSLPLPPNVTRPGDSRERLLDTKTWESNFNFVLLATARRLSKLQLLLYYIDLLHNLTASRVVLKYPNMDKSDEHLSSNGILSNVCHNTKYIADDVNNTKHRW